MIYWYWRYIPCEGVKLGFEEFDLYPDTEPVILHLRRRDPKQRIKIRRKHIQEDDDESFKRIDGIDFEIALRSESGDGIFFVDPVHVFSFLLMIKTGGWINAPAMLTASMLDGPDADGPYIFCTPFIESTPTRYQNVTLTMDDAVWIQENMNTGLRFTKESIFQNAMQALTSFHCVPYANVGLLIAWSGLEALFKTSQEISFRLCLYIANYLKKGPERAEVFERLRRSYDVRSKVTHGSGARLDNIHEHAEYTRDILCECLAKCIECGEFPDTKFLIFGE
jgi:hypothetical protein